MSASPPLQLQTCPHCGADCEATADRCWLCYGELSPKGDDVVAAEVVREPPRYAPEDTVFATMSAVLALIILLVGVGSAFVQPGVTILMAIVVVPALVATLVRVGSKQARTGYVSWGERLGTFLISASLTVGVLVLLALSAIIALVVYCFYLISSGGFH